MKELLVNENNEDIYILIDEYNNKYDLNIHIMDIDYEIIVGDTLYIDGGMIRDERVFTFGKLDSEYGRKIDNNNDKEVVVFKQKDNKYYMKRYYGQNIIIRNSVNKQLNIYKRYFFFSLYIQMDFFLNFLMISGL